MCLTCIIIHQNVHLKHVIRMPHIHTLVSNTTMFITPHIDIWTQPDQCPVR